MTGNLANTHTYIADNYHSWVSQLFKARKAVAPILQIDKVVLKASSRSYGHKVKNNVKYPFCQSSLS